MVKPGQADAAVMRLPNGRFLAIKGDGNSRQASLDPYGGAAGCVAEACRNVVAVGAEPIALVDHLQSGTPPTRRSTGPSGRTSGVWPTTARPSASRWWAAR